MFATLTEWERMIVKATVTIAFDCTHDTIVPINL
jgi:hypothetical protein